MDPGRFIVFAFPFTNTSSLALSQGDTCNKSQGAEGTLRLVCQLWNFSAKMDRLEQTGETKIAGVGENLPVLIPDLRLLQRDGLRLRREAVSNERACKWTLNCLLKGAFPYAKVN